jgi:hypothetical protein
MNVYLEIKSGPLSPDLASGRLFGENKLDPLLSFANSSCLT